MGDTPLSYTIADASSGTGVDGVTLGPHSIHSYQWTPSSPSPTLIETAQVLVQGVKELEKLSLPKVESPSMNTLIWLLAATVLVPGMVAAFLKTRHQSVGSWPEASKSVADHSYVEFSEVPGEEASIRPSSLSA